MNTIEINVENNKASINNVSPEQITSGSRKLTSIDFKFSSEWIGFIKTVILYADQYDAGKAVKIILENDRIKVEELPPVLMSKKCDLYIGVFGDNEAGQRITSNLVCIPIVQGVPTKGVNLDITPDLYNQIINVVNDAKQIAQSVRDDVDNGKFDGKDGAIGPQGEQGPSGHTPVKNVDYFTNDEIEEIINNAASRVDLSNHVIKTRKVAGYSLESDIDANMLAGTIAHEFVKGGSWYSELMPWLEKACGSRKQQDTNTQDIKELKKKGEWELILDKTLPVQSTDGTLLDFEDLQLDGQYNELRFVTVMWTSGAGAVALYVNNSTEQTIKLQGMLATNATFTYDFTLQDTDLPGRYLLLTGERMMSGANATSSEVKRYQNSGSDETIPTVTSIKNLKLELAFGWNNSTARYVRVYGRK